MPFIIWFDQAKEWFVVLNIFLGGILVDIFGRLAVGRMPRLVLPALCGSDSSSEFRLVDFTSDENSKSVSGDCTLRRFPYERI